MEMQELKIKDFVSDLASSKPVPGGGGVAALAAALSVSLNSMVASLTIGKKKYAQVEDEVKKILKESNELSQRFLSLIDEDAKAFEPLSKAYALPKEEREKVLQPLLENAASVPFSIIRNCAMAISLIEVLAHKGSVLAISDAACAASLCFSAARCALYNVLVNTNLMTDKKIAKDTNENAEKLVKEIEIKSKEIESFVYGNLT